MSCPELGLPNGPIHELLSEIVSAAVPTLHILPHILTHPRCLLSASIRSLSVPEPFPLLPAHSSLEPSTLTASIFLPLGPLATSQSLRKQVQKFRALPCLLSASAPADSLQHYPKMGHPSRSRDWSILPKSVGYPQDWVCSLQYLYGVLRQHPSEGGGWPTEGCWDCHQRKHINIGCFSYTTANTCVPIAGILDPLNEFPSATPRLRSSRPSLDTSRCSHPTHPTPPPPPPPLTPATLQASEGQQGPEQEHRPR